MSALKEFTIVSEEGNRSMLHNSKILSMLSWLYGQSTAGAGKTAGQILPRKGKIKQRGLEKTSHR